MGNGQSQTGVGKVHWRSRRGMLEVEVELVPFVRDHFANLAAADKEAYSRLLEQDDWTIHDWLRGVSRPADEAQNRIVTLIRRARNGAGASVDQR